MKHTKQLINQLHQDLKNKTINDIMLWVECESYQQEIDKINYEIIKDNNNQKIGHVTFQFQELKPIGKTEDEFTTKVDTMEFIKICQENNTLHKNLETLRGIIDSALNHERTQLGQNAIKQIIANYNDYILNQNTED